jgi:catechol 2,3-dioxygenase-like lactoylglutathione lyase family enzyme
MMRVLTRLTRLAYHGVDPPARQATNRDLRDQTKSYNKGYKEDTMIKGLHHNAYRCRDSAQTRAFYEGFLGLPLVDAFEIGETKTGRKTRALHSFYQMDDGSCLAFFETPDMPFEFKEQHDFDLHIALEVAPDVLEPMLARGKAAGIATRGPSDHGFIRSIYFRDPNGYVIELTAKVPGPAGDATARSAGAHKALDRWMQARTST